MKQDRREYTLKEELTTCHRTARPKWLIPFAGSVERGFGWEPYLLSSPWLVLLCPEASTGRDVWYVRWLAFNLAFLEPWILNAYQSHPPTSYDFLLQRKPTQVWFFPSWCTVYVSDLIPGQKYSKCDINKILQSLSWSGGMVGRYSVAVVTHGCLKSLKLDYPCP